LISGMAKDGKMSSDPRGYYADLGVSPTASIDEIKSVYRALVRIYHPDVNRDRAATEKFRRIADAYETIGDEKKKRDYDSQTAAANNSSHQDNDEPSKQPSHEPVRCAMCKKVTAQPRFITFRYVVSLVVITTTKPKSEIYCRDCASKAAFRASAISAACGWWGFPWGPLLTIKEIVRNALGGDRNSEIDEQLLWQNAVAFAQSNRLDLAASIAKQLSQAKSKEIAEAANRLLEILVRNGQKVVPLNSPWTVSMMGFISQIAMGCIVPLLLWTWFSWQYEGNSATFNKQKPSPLDFSDLSDPVSSTTSKRQERLSEAGQSKPTEIFEPETPVNQCSKLPRNGHIFVRGKTAARNGHRLTVRNGSSGDAIVKLRKASNRKLVTSFFVSNNQSASINDIPDGEYRVQFAFGEAMTFNCHSFINPSSNEFEGTQKFTTDVTDTQIITRELMFTLYNVPNGNVRHSRIDAVDFEAN
jgi:DnaJ domain